MLTVITFQWIVKKTWSREKRFFFHALDSLASETLKNDYTKRQKAHRLMLKKCLDQDVGYLLRASGPRVEEDERKFLN